MTLDEPPSPTPPSPTPPSPTPPSPGWRERGRSIFIVLAYLVGGVAAAVATVYIVQALDFDEQAQRIAAFVVVGATLVLLALNRRVEVGEPVPAVATLIGICIVTVAALGSIGAIEEDPPLGCVNSDGPIPATVSGETTVVYTRATAASEPKRLLLRGCQVHAERWCVGAVHRDAIETNVLDTRWLVLPENLGLVPMGRTVGPTPSSRLRGHCNGDVPPPDRVQFAAAALDQRSGVVALHAKAPRAAVIGFAVRVPGRGWYRIGWDKTPEDDAPLLAPAPPGSPLGAEVAAVACIAFQVPSRAVATAKLRRGRGLATKLPLLRQPLRMTPGAAACDAAIPPPIE